jgi:hypothetical protein
MTRDEHARTIYALVGEFVRGKDEVTAAEIAAFLIDVGRQEWDVDDEMYEASTVARSLLWRGATSHARDVMKRSPVLVEDVLEQAETAQDTLFDLDEFGGFVRYAKDEDGAWKFKRRRTLRREEYEYALSLLREKHHQIGEKVKRYQADYDRAVPFWRPGLTFGEAFLLASEGKTGR